MRVSETLLALLLAAASVGLYAFGQTLPAFAAAALGALLLAHTRGDDLPAAPKHRVRATAAAILNIALVAGLAGRGGDGAASPSLALAARGPWSTSAPGKPTGA